VGGSPVGLGHLGFQLFQADLQLLQVLGQGLADRPAV
jgi:hypothetical protein